MAILEVGLNLGTRTLIERKYYESGSGVGLDSELRAQKYETEFRQAQASLNAVYNSYSWKLTKPFRDIKKIIKKNSNKINEIRSHLAKKGR